MKNFATCHCHPQSLDSASTPEAFVKREQELGTGTVTVTDHGSLAACRKIYDLAKPAGLIPVLGMEAYFRDDNCPILGAAGVVKNADGKYTDHIKYHHLTLHFLDQKAFEVGVRLLSFADARAERHGQERKPLFDWANLEELGAQNVTMTSSCLVGMVQRHILDHNDTVTAIKYYEKLRNLVKPGNFYVEVFPHICDRDWVKGVFLTLADGSRVKYHTGKNLRTNVGEIKADKLAAEFRRGGSHKYLVGVKDYQTWNEREPIEIVGVNKVEEFIKNECRPWAPDGDVQLGCNRVVRALAKRYGDTIIIGDDSHFATPDEKIIQDVRLLQGGGSWRFYGSYHRQTSEEAFTYFKNKMNVGEAEFESWVENSHAWASRFKGFKFDTQPSLPTKFYPENTLSHTLDLIKKHGRMDTSNPVYVNRLRTELKLLHENGVIDLLPYFFLDEEACSVYERNGLITGPGRGSAAGLLLTYLLGITHVDPIKYDLSLERFLTLDRIRSGRLPDIDQDLPGRDLLTGWEEPGLEVEMEDGTKTTVSKGSFVITPTGQMSVEEAFKTGAEVLSWK